MNRKLIYIVFSFLLINTLYADVQKISDTYLVLITKTVSHIALDKTEQGIIDTLNKSDIKVKVKSESAQANTTLASQIASKFAIQNPGVIVGIGTLSAQSVLKYVRNSPFNLVFSSVTDPIGANIILNDKKYDRTSGVSNFIDVKPQIELFKKIQPNLKNLGVIYHPSEINSVKILNELVDICKKNDINLVQQVITKSADIPVSTSKIIKKVDAIFISNDNTALSGINNIIRIATANNVAVYVSDTDAVSLGAIAALGPNQYELGCQTGEMIIKILKKDKDIKPIVYSKKTELYININTAKKLNITLSGDLIKSADVLVN